MVCQLTVLLPMDNWKSFQTLSFCNTRTVIYVQNNKYQKWREFAKFLFGIWSSPYPHPPNTSHLSLKKREKNKNLALCLPRWSGAGRPGRGS